MSAKPLASGATVTTGFLNDLVSVYDKTTAEIDVVNTAVETVIYTKSILAGNMSTDRELRLTLYGDYLNNTGVARNLTVKVTFGGTVLYVSTFGNVASSVGRRPFRIDLNLANLAAAVQFLSGVIYMGSAGIISGGMTGLGDAQGGHEGADSALGANKTKTTPISTNGNAALDTSTAKTLEVLVTHNLADVSLSCRRKRALLELC